MAIRDRFRRALRKSDDSDTISQTESNSTAASSTRQSFSDESPSLQLQKTSSSLGLSRAFTFGSRNKEKDLEKKRAKEEQQRKKSKTKTYVHPRDKPLSEQNLKHQEMLSHFTMTFGATNLSQIEDIDWDGVSPCCTRQCSIDGGPRS